MSVGSWHVVDIGRPQRDEVLDLFAQVFGGTMPPDLWHWKYGDGRGLATGTRGDDGRLLAHYGGTARTLMRAGQPMEGVQLGDVMVAQDVRGILSRRGPFATAARGFLERHVGTEAGFACGFGFPNDRAARLGEALGLYETVGTILQVQWPAMRPARALEARVRWRLAPIDWSHADTPARLDALWAELLAAPLARQCVLPRRDAAWWRHRFGNHPQAPYRCFWVHRRWSGQLLGAVALRPSAHAGGPWELLDWLAPPDRMGSMVAAARTLCQQQGASGMMGWLSEPLATRLLADRRLADGQAQPACSASMTLRRASWLAGPNLSPLWWWLTGGDTDFR